MKVHNLSIDSSQRDVSIYPYANNYVISLENPIYDVEEIRLVSGFIPTPQTPSPNSIILRLSSGSDEFNQSVYSGSPHYTGHILLNGGTTLLYNGSDDPLIHRFHSGAQKSITELSLEFLYLNSGVLTSYDFGATNHTLKFEVKCSTDKLENLKVEPPEEEVEEKSDISIPVKSDLYEWKKEYTYIIAIVVVGLLLMMLMKRRPKPISE
jgi:hypothetical protein